MSFNVHSLLHLADDAAEYGCLDNISCFPFENYLGHLKRIVLQNSTRPAAQLMKRDSMKCEETPVSNSSQSRRPNTYSNDP